MTPSDNVVVLAAIREVRKAEAIRRAFATRHPSTRSAQSDGSPTSTGADPVCAAAHRVELDPEGDEG